MSENSDLKCTACGSAARITPDFIGFCVQCQNGACRMSGPVDKDESGAVKKWKQIRTAKHAHKK